VENRVLGFAEAHPEVVQACVTKPGMINGEGRRERIEEMAKKMLEEKGEVLPVVEVAELAAAMLKQALNGIEKDTLLNDELVTMGQQALKEQAGS
jgi:hypothetical protein